MKVLFVCQGNVGRSQFAEAIFNQLTDGAHEVVSAGTRVVKGEDISREGQTLKETENSGNVLGVLQELGIDASSYKRKQLTPEMVEWADKIVVMAEKETIPDYLAKSPKAEYWEIMDPYMQSREVTREIRDKISAYLKGFIGTL